MIRRYLASLSDFWPYYVREHSRRGTRWLHFVGNTNLLMWIFLAILHRSLALIAIAILSSYALAWIGHFFVERNIPATFRYPLKAALCDMIMYYKMWKGEMNAEVEKYSKNSES